MRAVVLVRTRPGAGPDVVESTSSARRAHATFGPFGAVVEAAVPDRDRLLEVLETINAVEGVIGSETLTNMDAPDPAPLGEGGLVALAMVEEDKSQGCDFAFDLPERLGKVEGVEDAYPVLGRFDQAVWIRADGLGGISETVARIGELDGVYGETTLIERPR